MNSFDKVQEAFSSEYGNNYPYSAKIKSSLELLLRKSYGGSWEQFDDGFVQPTLKILKLLKTRGFPLVVDGKVIVHLAAPEQGLESGEMYFQVGYSDPGTLALKFTKYVGSDVVMQPSTVEEKDYGTAFTPTYFEELRKKATLGDQLMRILVVSVPNKEGCKEIQKVEARRIMLCHIGRKPESETTTSGKESSSQPNTGASYSTVVMESYPSYSNDKTENPAYPPTDKVVSENPLPGVYSCEVENPGYPLIHDAVTENTNGRDASQSTTDKEIRETAVSFAAIKAAQGTPDLKGNQQNPPYPSVENAVKSSEKDDTFQNNQNPLYPHVAIKAAQGTADLKGTQQNPSYPSVENAVKSSEKDDTFQNNQNPLYPHVAIKAAQGTADLKNNQLNPPYPSVENAVKSSEKDDTFQNNQNPLYPHVAIKAAQGTADLKGNQQNPSYPSVENAVKSSEKDDTFQNNQNPLYPHVAIKAAQGTADLKSNQQNPSYPSVENAVKSSEKDDTFQNNQNPSYPHAAMKATQRTADLKSNQQNPQYPSVENAAKSSEKDCIFQNNQNPSYPDEAIKAIQGTADLKGNQQNPQYPSVENAVKSSEKEYTFQNNQNPSYPHVSEAVRGSKDFSKEMSTKPGDSYPERFPNVMDTY